MKPAKIARSSAWIFFAAGGISAAIEQSWHPATGMLFIIWAIFVAASLVIDAIEAKP